MTSEPHDRLRITGAANMRALAHPARLASLQHLMRVGPATATELGELAGLTPSAMSYHLRALERAGLIETAPSRGDGRERVWRSVHSGTGWHVETPDDGSEESRLASLALMEAAITLEEVVTRRWLAGADQPGWADYGQFMSSTVLLNQAELEEVGREILRLLRPFQAQERGGAVPADAVAMRAFFKCFPSE